MIPQSPIVSSAAWLGSEQQKRTDWIYRLSDAEKGELDTAVRSYQIRREPLLSVNASEYPIPVLATAIENWMSDLDDGRGFILVRGFPAGKYSQDEVAFAYWLIGLHMGRSVPQNRKGDLLGQVRDDGADPNNPAIRLYRTRARLDFHTDGADLIDLMCLQTPSRAAPAASPAPFPCSTSSCAGVRTWSRFCSITSTGTEGVHARNSHPRTPLRTLS